MNLSKISKLTLLITNLLLISNIAIAKPLDECVERSDQEYKKLMLGTWVGTEEYTIHGETHLSDTTNYQDGTIVVHTFAKKSPHKIAEVIKGKWDVAKGINYQFAISTEPKELVKVFRNQVIADKIICMSANKLIVVASDGVRLEFNKKNV